MKTKLLIIITSVCLLVSIPHAFATEPQIIQIFQPNVELLPDEKIVYGESFTIHAWLQSYDNRPDNLGFYVNVLDPQHNQVDSTLWFAKQDFVYEFDTTHSAYNITKSGIYQIKIEKADLMERTGIFPKTITFEILFPEPEEDEHLSENCGPGTTLQNGICVVDDIKENTTDSVRWGGPANNVKSPLKQIKFGIALSNIQCSDEKHVIYKHDRMRAACVTSSTYGDLIERGWAALRLETHATDDVGRNLCNLYEGQWDILSRYCHGLQYPLLCSMAGGDMMDDSCFIPSTSEVSTVNQNEN